MGKLNKKIKDNRGMTYVELIVVLSIFSVMTSVILFNYNAFQAKVDIKVLANDIAIKIVEAQKSALSGKLSLRTHGAISDWKPSYGVYFDLSTSDSKKKFVYFTDSNQDKDYAPSCPGVDNTEDECIDEITITKNNFISDFTVFYENDSSAVSLNNDLTITFTRPDSGVIIKSTMPFVFTVSYVQITISSVSGITAKIKIYPSGRIQIN
ncbi:hypothetical protein A3B84_00385 [Candidatus Nomurabacteria bacterium RIFCSPHIGHO2_02_FULL_35_13]|uniref:General secretion pathway GspH domain-containing protein n=2 Tax=Candidatus Nomuraibacteriota TaxID=1752729 RepID=A0A1F6VPJ6_9BACT|nr:MAG: hypothetical protein UR88_C0009G0005 [Candidatus Nomurabacteria bacterium GW2011_GWA1_35_8]OGI71553.1 MAG: hypothetical protein A3B84_00385 [Candidatus Nomurabacteria bacterium RIFCSPHIGHO2_02_FULL_35_13]